MSEWCSGKSARRARARADTGAQPRRAGPGVERPGEQKRFWRVELLGEPEGLLDQTHRRIRLTLLTQPCRCAHSHHPARFGQGQTCLGWSSGAAVGFHVRQGRRARCTKHRPGRPERADQDEERDRQKQLTPRFAHPASHVASFAHHPVRGPHVVGSGLPVASLYRAASHPALPLAARNFVYIAGNADHLVWELRNASTSSVAIAKFRPCAETRSPPSPTGTVQLETTTPASLPSIFNMGPPEFPGLMAVSV
jgi:hypothetical protein